MIPNSFAAKWARDPLPALSVRQGFHKNAPGDPRMGFLSMRDQVDRGNLKLDTNQEYEANHVL